MSHNTQKRLKAEVVKAEVRAALNSNIEKAARVAIVNSPKKNRKRKRVQRRNQTLGSKRARKNDFDIVTAYTDTLNNPFKFAGCNLGYGCFIPTALKVLYTKGSATVNADGSFSVGMIPYSTGTGGSGLQGAIVGFSASGVSTVPTWTYSATANNGSFINEANFARTVSGGLKVWIRYPKTSQAGILNSYAIPTSAAALPTTTPTGGLSIPTAKTIGDDSAMICYRPTDFADFNFILVSGGALSLCLGSWQGIVQGLGYPTGSTVYWEAIQHVETYTTNDTSSADVASDSGVSYLSGVFANIETAYRTVSKNLGPEVMSAGEQLIYSTLGNAVGMKTAVRDLRQQGVSIEYKDDL